MFIFSVFQWEFRNILGRKPCEQLWKTLWTMCKTKAEIHGSAHYG